MSKREVGTLQIDAREARVALKNAQAAATAAKARADLLESEAMASCAPADTLDQSQQYQALPQEPDKPQPEKDDTMSRSTSAFSPIAPGSTGAGVLRGGSLSPDVRRPRVLSQPLVLSRGSLRRMDSDSDKSRDSHSSAHTPTWSKDGPRSLSPLEFRQLGRSGHVRAGSWGTGSMDKDERIRELEMRLARSQER